MIEINKADMMSLVKDLRFKKEVRKDNTVGSVGDETPEHARAFEAITHAWVYDAKLPLNQMRGLDFDQVEEDATMPLLKSLLNGANQRTITPAANPGEFNALLNTPLGRIGDDIVTYTPINKRIDRFEIQKARDDVDSDDEDPEPAFQVFFV